MRRAICITGLDLGFLAAAFMVVHALNYGHLAVSASNWDVFQVQIAVWLLVSMMVGKFTRISGMRFMDSAGLLLKTGVAMLFLLSFIIVSLQMMHFSRIMAYGTVIVFLAMEAVFLGVYHWVQGSVAVEGKPLRRPGFWQVQRPLFLIDGALLVVCFFAATFLKRGSLALDTPYDDILLILLGLWLGGSLFTRKFIKDNFNDFFSAFGPALKTILFMAAGLAFFIYLLRLGPVSRFQAFGPLLIFAAMEGLVFMLYVNYREHGGKTRDIEDVGTVRELLGAEKDQEELVPAGECAVSDPAEEKLRHALDFFDPRIFELLCANVDLAKIDRADCALLSTDNMFNLDVLESGKTKLLINLHKINDMRWFNRYFLLAHEKLANGAYFMGKAHTISTNREYFRDKYPGRLGRLFYGVSFIWKRVFPKLPWLQKIYFAVSGGRNRIVSRAEILGRLCFCGFEIVSEADIGHRYFFVARKAKTPCGDENPTYGPLVRLNRTGVGGRPITVFKFRTMHPYSEYLQEYVYQQNQLDQGGKFKDDFRVTEWGRFMRQTWLDELPMLYNWLRGDLQVVGVRPLSSQYLQLYDADLQALRQRVKPGLLPPFYADMPVDLEGIMDSERRYIEQFLERPVRTQVRYFWKSFWNIGVRGKRSG